MTLTTIITYTAEGIRRGHTISGTYNPETIFRKNKLAVRLDITTTAGDEEVGLTFWRSQFNLG